MNKETGGAAFPLPKEIFGESFTRRDTPSPIGMTLRDYFASKAMEALVRNTAGMISYTNEFLVAEAYNIADCMIAERSRE